MKRKTKSGNNYVKYLNVVLNVVCFYMNGHSSRNIFDDPYLHNY